MTHYLMLNVGMRRMPGIAESPSNQGRVPGLKRKPPGLLARALAVHRKMRRHCWLKFNVADDSCDLVMQQVCKPKVTRLCQLCGSCMTLVGQVR